MTATRGAADDGRAYPRPHGVRAAGEAGAADACEALTRREPLMAAIESVYRAKFATFHRVACAITGDADLGRDAVQEAFARAIRRRADFRGEGPLEGWLWRTVVNAARDQSRKARAMVDSDELHAVAEPSVAGHDRDATRELIRARIASLPDRQRIALFLRYYADLSYAEIATALEIRTGTVSATLNAAHKALERDLAGMLDRAPHADGPARQTRRNRRGTTRLAKACAVRAAR